MSNKIKKSLFFKSVSLFLVLSFSFYNVSFASIAKDDMAVAKISLETSPLMVEDIGIAIDCGTIKSLHQASGNKVIIHIQDAHCNYEAQQNINRILEQLSSECGVNMISVEGAEGLVDTSWFRAFPDAEIRKEVATYFMKKGEITGAEFFSIISDDFTGTIFGAEDREAYIKNLKAFTTTYPYKPMIESFFQDTLTIANRLKAIIYSKKLKELDLKIRAFDSKEIELSTFAAYLNKCVSKNKINLTDYPDFKKLVDTLEYEAKIDFDIVDQERSEYIDSLSKKLSKEEMTELVTYSIKFKKGHIKAVEFYSYLRGIAREQNIPMLQEYPNLFYYYIYTKLYDGIDNEKLFKEINDIETILKDKLFQDDTERTLDKYAETLDMYVNLVNIELTNDDYALFQKYTSEFSVEDIIEFLGGLCARYNLNYSIDTVPEQISKNIPNMVDFYEIAMKRDKALVDNTLAQMDKEKKNVSVLIAGGFHTRGMKNLLEKQGVSYVVVMPKITKDVETPYIKVLTNQRTSLEDILTESAMPVPGASVPRKEGVQVAKPTLLSPLMRVAFGVNLLLNDPKLLQEWSEAIGKIEAGETFTQKAQETFNETVDMSTSRWLDAIRTRMVKEFGPEYAKEEWKKFVNDDVRWGLLLSIYLGTYRDAGVAVDTYPIVAKAIEDRFTQYRSTKRETAGENDILGNTLTKKQAREVADKVIAANYSPENVEERNDIRDGFSFVKSPALTEAFLFAELPPQVAHPGTGGEDETGERRELLQVHIDDEVYEMLLADYKDQLMVVGNHELAHLDIANGIDIEKLLPGASEDEVLVRIEKERGTKTANTWYEWTEEGRPKGQGQEDFVNSLPGCKISSEAGKAINEIIEKKRERIAHIKKITATLKVKEKAVKRSVDEWLDHVKQLAGDAWNEYYVNGALWGYLNVAYDDMLHDTIGMTTNVDNAMIKQEFAKYRTKEMEADVDDELTARFKDMVQPVLVPQDEKICLLFAGGGGTRLIGVSTSEIPKQIAPIFKDPKTNEMKSSLQISIERAIAAGFSPQNIRIQTTGALLSSIQEILVEMNEEGLVANNAYAEPAFADTAAAFGYGFALLQREKDENGKSRGGNAVFVGTADHIIDVDDGEFQRTVNNALGTVYVNPVIATIGIVALEPSEEFGHLEVGPETPVTDIYALEGFEEKPKGDRAQELFDRGDLFNSGMFLATPDTVMEEFKKIAEKNGLNPDVDDCYYNGLKRIADAKEGAEYDAAEKEEFAKFKQWKADGEAPETAKTAERKKGGVSFDYVIAEQSDIMVTTKGDFYWRDIGGYKAIHEQYADTEGKYYVEGKTVDVNGNVFLGREGNSFTFTGCKDCLVIVMDNTDGENFTADISLREMENQLVIYNPSKRMTMVTSLDTLGSVLKDIQNDVLKSDSYTAQFIAAGTPKLTDTGTNFSQIGNPEERVVETAGERGIVRSLGAKDVEAWSNYGLLLLPGTKETKITLTSAGDELLVDVSKVPDVEVVVGMIMVEASDDLNKKLAEMDKVGRLTSNFVQSVINDFNKSQPNSRARTEMVSFCNTIFLKYGDKAIKKGVKAEKDMLIRGDIGDTIDPDIYRRDSVRAVADLEMTDPIMRAAGAAYVKTLVQLRNKRPEDITIAIGRESRVSGARIMAAFTEGCRDAGATVIDATNGGELITSTPIMYFASRYLADGKLDGIVETTASHLSGEMNGLKPTTGSINFTSTEMQIWLENTHDAIDRGTIGVAPRGRVEKAPILESYHVLLTAALQGSEKWKGYVNDVYADKMTLKAAIEAINKDDAYITYANSRPLAGVKLAADSAYGSMGPIMAPILKKLGAECVDIGGTADFSLNKTGVANPNVPENLNALANKVREIGAMFGIAEDNDGDRLGVATPNHDKKKGRLRGDDISCVMVKSIIEKAKADGIEHPVIVMNVLCSDRLKKTIEHYGGTVEESGVGFNTVKEVMAKNDAVQGVEISSHIMFKENFNADDAFFAVIKLLGVVSEEIRKYEERGELVPIDILGAMLDEIDQELREDENIRYVTDYHTGEWRTEMVSNQARVVVAEAIGEHYKEMATINPDKYKIRNELDGIKIDFYRDGEQVGFLAVRPSGTSPQMVIAINSTISENDFNMIKNDFFAQMKEHQDSIVWDSPKLEPATYVAQAKAFVFDGISLPVSDATSVDFDIQKVVTTSEDFAAMREAVEKTKAQENKILEVVNIEKTFDRGESISGTDKVSWSDRGQINVSNDAVVNMSDVLITNGPDIAVPAIIGSREHTLVVQEGQIQIILPNGQAAEGMFEKGAILRMAKGQLEAIDQNGKYFKYEWTPLEKSIECKIHQLGANRVKVRVLYANDQQSEAPIYTAYHMVAKYKDVLARHRVGYIAPDILFAQGKGPNSVSAERKAINRALGSKDRGAYNIRTYNGCVFDSKGNLQLGQSLKDILTAIDNLHKENREIEVLLTKSQVTELVDNIGDFETGANTNYAKLWGHINSGNVRIQTIEDISEEKLYADEKIGGKRIGWFFMRETQVGVFMQAALEKADIVNASFFAQDTRSLMEVFTGRKVLLEDLYFMLPFNEMPTEILDKAGNLVPVNLALWATSMLEKLLLTMPMQPLEYLREQLENRRHVMYSV